MNENEAFFRRCWLTLKAASITTRKKKLLEQMNEIECAAGSVRVTISSPVKKSEGSQYAREPDKEFVRV